MSHQEIERLALKHNIEIMLIPFYKEKFMKFVEAVLKEASKDESH